MLSQLDTQTKVSTPLLASASTNPLIILGSSNDWLVWLQYNTPRPNLQKYSFRPGADDLIRRWTLNALHVGAQTRSISGFDQPIQLFADTFDQKTAPNWVHTPVQGVWFLQNTLLFTTIDSKGDAHLQ